MSEKSLFFSKVIAEEAAPVENLDPAAARDVLSKAQSQLTSAASDRVRYTYILSKLHHLKMFYLQEKAEAAIAVEVGEALIKAVE